MRFESWILAKGIIFKINVLVIGNGRDSFGEMSWQGQRQR